MLTAIRYCPAPAKLNLFLHVTGQRPDGYHTIETVFDFIDLADTLHFKLRNDGVILLKTPTPGVPPELDLTVRAARALAIETNCELGVEINIEKLIPIGGGLGGGSSNAASTLLALNRLWGLHLSVAKLAGIGLKLGADVPVFVRGQPAHATGIGEKLSPLKLPIQHYVLISPPAAVPTGEIFGAPELTRDSKPITILGSSRSEWFASGRNDMQPVVVARYPQVGVAIEALDRAAAAVSKLISKSANAKAASVDVKLASAKNAGADVKPALAKSAGVDAKSAVALSAARMSGSGACVFLPVASAEIAEMVAEQARKADAGDVIVARSLPVHPLRDWSTGR
jgi:4-diphosphocytidyl-2-C-methyl-D-erythritol kinase